MSEEGETLRLLNSMDEKIFSDLEQKIVKSFSKKDHVVYNEHVDLVKFNGKDPRDLFLPLSKVSMLIYGDADFEFLTSRQPPRVDINAPILDGLFPLHLAVLTSSARMIRKLIQSYRAKLDVKCCDPDSPFHGLTPLDLALLVMRRNLIPWAPQMSVHELLSKFHGNAKVKSLMLNISILASITPRIRDLITEYSLQGKVVELAALLEVASSYSICFSTIYIPSADIPPELQFGVPMTLRLLVAARSASLVKEGIQLSSSLNPEEYDQCRIKLKEMDAIMTLLESAERGDLMGFDEKQQLTAEIIGGSSEGSQDESKVNRVAPQYLKNSLLYVEPSKFQPPGIFNSMMPQGYNDSLRHYDGLDIRNCNALAETIFRVLDGRKVEELSLEDTRKFRHNLKDCLKIKFKAAETLTALEEKGTKNEAEEKQWSTPGSSLPRSLTTALKPGGFFPLNKAFEHLDVKKISTLVISAVKKGKA